MSAENIVYSTALNDGMPDMLAKLIVAQSKHETGNYTSAAFTQLNNAFGYSYYAGSDWQLSAPGFIADNGAPLARYANVVDSVHELTHWIARRQGEGEFPANLATIQTPEQYAAYLKNAGFYGDTLINYVNGLKRWFTYNLTAVTGTFALLLALGAAYLIARNFASK